MSASLTCTPTAPVSKVDFCRINVSGASANDATGYDITKYPTEPQITYVLKFVDANSVVQGESPVFSPNPYDGTWEFNNYIFPTSGTYSVELYDVNSSSNAATLSVTVS